jgi:hypothetical protein
MRGEHMYFLKVHFLVLVVENLDLFKSLLIEIISTLLQIFVFLESSINGTIYELDNLVHMLVALIVKVLPKDKDVHF